jgi:hypothetical protein
MAIVEVTMVWPTTVRPADGQGVPGQQAGAGVEG